jgi:predicted molibdopterin-dependent oxidoreductase YjgC
VADGIRGATTARRIDGAVRRGPPVTIFVDDRPLQCFMGESVAAALLAAGADAFRRSVARDEPRGPFCLMGVCQECALRIDGRVEASCRVPVGEGMRIERMRR